MSDSAQDGTKVWVVSIHDKAAQGYLAFDLNEILICLGDSAKDYHWLVADVECSGEAPPTGVLMPTEELLHRAEKFVQTISGLIVGLPNGGYSAQEVLSISEIRQFPASRACIAILAVDSSFFEILTKDYDHVRLLKNCFQDVRQEDPNMHFRQPGLG